jgi:hypothetical protein
MVLLGITNGPSIIYCTSENSNLTFCAPRGRGDLTYCEDSLCSGRTLF